MRTLEPESLMATTMELLKARQQPLTEIQSATGISFYWLRRFLGGEFSDPSVNRVQKLYEYLAQRKLQV